MISISAFLEHHRNHYCVGCVIIEHSCWTTNGYRDSSISWRLNYRLSIGRFSPFLQLSRSAYWKVIPSLIHRYWKFLTQVIAHFSLVQLKRWKYWILVAKYKRTVIFFHPVGCQMKGNGSSSKSKFLKVVMATITKCKLQLASPALEWQLCKYKQELTFFFYHGTVTTGYRLVDLALETVVVVVEYYENDKITNPVAWA